MTMTIEDRVTTNWHWRQAHPGWAAEQARKYRKNNPVKARYNVIKQWDKINGFEDDTLTFQEFEEAVRPMVCSYTGLQLRWDGGVRDDLAPSLDRIENSLGHSKENVRLTCLRVNLMRGNLSVKDFLWFCGLVAEREETP